MSRGVIVVTGGNRGIGRAICNKLLSNDPHVKVVMCCRKEFEFDNHGGRLSQLVMDVTKDVDIKNAVEKVGEMVKGTNEGITLVNNAGLGDDLEWKSNSDPQAAQRVLDVNVFGLEKTTRGFLPLISRPGADTGRVINVSSGAGVQNLSRSSEEVQKFLLREDITWEEIAKSAEKFISEYVEAQNEANNGGRPMPRLSDSGYWLQSYGFSKALVNSYSRHLSKVVPKNVVVHSCSPGFVLTEMTQEYVGDMKHKTTEQGAETPCFLALGGADDIETSFFKGDGSKGAWLV